MPARATAQFEALGDCILHFEQLGAELRTAMTAIAANSPIDLEASLPRQKDLARQLEGKLARAQAQWPVGPSGLVWRKRLERAALAVDRLNRQYAALLEHSGRSIKMMSALYQIPPHAHAGVGGRQGRSLSWNA